MSKLRPTRYLFLAALAGSFCAGAMYYNFLFFIIIAAVILTLIPIYSKNIFARALCAVGLVFLLCAGLGIIKLNKYKIILQNIPKHKTIFDGKILDIKTKINFTKQARARIFFKYHNKTYKIIINLTLRDSAAALKIKPGDYIRINAKITPNSYPLSAIDFDNFTFGLAQSFHGSAVINNKFNIYYRSNNKFLLAKFRFFLRKQILSYSSPYQAGLLLALICGETDMLSVEQKNIFKILGAQHLLAVSGLQVTLITIIIFYFLNILFNFLIPPRFTSYFLILNIIITILSILFFVALCSWPKSALRAGIMSSILFLKIIFKNNIDSEDALNFSGLLILLWDPTSIYDIGFLLSYAAVFGIIYFHNSSKNFISQTRYYSVVASYLLNIFFISLGASLATLPIIIFYFKKFVPHSILTNFVLTPIATLVQAPAIIFGILGAAFNISLFFEFSNLCCFMLDNWAFFLSRYFSKIFIIPENLKLLLSIILLGLFVFGRSIFKLNKNILYLSIILIFLPIFKFCQNTNSQLEVYFLPVGHGDAALITTPNKKYILIDTGGSAYKNSYKNKIVNKLLLDKNIHKIHILVITHLDSDHAMGLLEILENFTIGEIWFGGIDKSHKNYEIIFDKIKNKKIVTKFPHNLLGSHIVDNLEIQILAPYILPGETRYEELNSNDNSLVIRLIYEDKKILFPGDIEFFGELLLNHAPLDISADIIKAPHHGSKTSSSVDFLRKVNPKLVIFSTGHRHRGLFPHPVILTRYKNLGAQILDTKFAGEILIRINKHGFVVQGFTPPFIKPTTYLN